MIAEVTDEATGLINELITTGDIITTSGAGIKIEGGYVHRDIVGIFFKPESGEPVKARVIAFNKPRTLKVLVPPELTVGTAYRISVGTLCSVKNSGYMLKKVRNIQSDFSLIAA